MKRIEKKQTKKQTYKYYLAWFFIYGSELKHYNTKMDANEN